MYWVNDRSTVAVEWNRGQEDAANKSDNKCSVKLLISRLDSVFSAHAQEEHWTGTSQRITRYVYKRNEVDVKCEAT